MSEPPKELLFTKIFSIIRDPKDWDDQNLEALAAIFVPLFDGAVDSLRDPKIFPNRRINKLVNLFWHLVGEKVTPLGITPAVSALCFWIEIKKGHRFASVVAPMTWPRQMIADPWLAFGGIVFTASQACDYHHFQVRSSQDIIARARAHEAEFYHTAQGISTRYALGLQRLCDGKPLEFTPNEYQREVIKEYPAGIQSLGKALFYPITPFSPGDFDDIEKATSGDN